MWFSSWLRSRQRPASPRKRPTFRPTLEALEERWVLSTLTVLNTNDSGAGSLRADIAAAGRNDTIVFAPSLDGQTITLTSGELLINKNLTITGPGAGELTISGNNASRVFEVAKGKQVALSGLTISNGLAVAGSGGGILVDAGGAGLTVSNTILSGNSAANGSGGAIANFGGTLTVIGSTLSDNQANSSGGAIMSNGGGTLTVTGSTLSDNHAKNGSGGAILNLGMLTVSGSTLSNNSAAYGGGILTGQGLTGQTATVTNSTLTGNTAAFTGGGIDVLGGTLTLNNSSLSGNTAAQEGGGIYTRSAGTVFVKNSSKMTGNTAPAGFGADVYNLGVMDLDVSSMIGILDGNPAKPI
jgi:hypothetical protein